jgi:hypothetical protein
VNLNGDVSMHSEASQLCIRLRHPLADFYWVQVEFSTPHDRVHIKCRKQDNGMIGIIEVPAGFQVQAPKDYLLAVEYRKGSKEPRIIQLKNSIDKIVIKT